MVGAHLSISKESVLSPSSTERQSHGPAEDHAWGSDMGKRGVREDETGVLVCTAHVFGSTISDNSYGHLSASGLLNYGDS